MCPAPKKFAILPDGDSARTYDENCRRCKRLAAFLDDVRSDHPDYFCKPVGPFGQDDARLVIVGLAPGMHGANASGRPFTGDYAGILLYETLYAYGFASAPVSSSRDDPLTLYDCRITNAVKCLPPDNKPAPSEVRECNRYLVADLATVHPGAAILALGRVAHAAVLLAVGYKLSQFPFVHGAKYALGNDIALFDSYHCSRYNTNTGRLTREMFRSVFEDILRHLAETTTSRSAADAASTPRLGLQ